MKKDPSDIDGTNSNQQILSSSKKEDERQFLNVNELDGIAKYMQGGLQGVIGGLSSSPEKQGPFTLKAMRENVAT